MSANPRLIVADSTKCKRHSVSIFSPHAVSKYLCSYLCSFLWCAFSRVRTETLSWLEGTLHALQRINIRTSMSRATRMLHTMATTAAVDSPVAEMESSRSHSCITDTETASLGSAVSPRRSVTCEAQRLKALLVEVTITLLSLLFVTQGSSWSSDPVWTRVSYFSHLLCSQIKDRLFQCWRKTLKLVWWWIKSEAWRWFSVWRALTLNGFTSLSFARRLLGFFSLFFGSTLFCEVGGNAKQSGFLLDEILDVITIIHLRLSFLSERENI